MICLRQTLECFFLFQDKYTELDQQIQSFFIIPAGLRSFVKDTVVFLTIPEGGCQHTETEPWHYGKLSIFLLQPHTSYKLGATFLSCLMLENNLKCIVFTVQLMLNIKTSAFVFPCKKHVSFEKDCNRANISKNKNKNLHMRYHVKDLTFQTVIQFAKITKVCNQKSDFNMNSSSE